MKRIDLLFSKFDASVLSERAERAERAPKAERAVREPKAPRSPAPPRSQREAEREAAYARNPDQPVVRKPATSPHVRAESGPRRGFGANRPVPALLMKRPAAPAAETAAAVVPATAAEAGKA